MVNLNGFKVKIPECLEEISGGYAVMQHGQQYSLELTNHHKDGGFGKPCDADVYIDGKHIGVFRVPYGQSIPIEHPVDDFGKFTAYQKGTPEFKEAEINVRSSEMGLIEVIFKPGTKKVKKVIKEFDPIPWVPRTPYKEPQPWIKPGVYAYAVTDWNTINTWENKLDSCATFSSRSLSGPQNVSCSTSCSEDSLIGGGTGLSGHSDQEFIETEELDYDEPATTIYIRLGFGEDKPRALKGIGKVYKTNKPRPLK